MGMARSDPHDILDGRTVAVTAERKGAEQSDLFTKRGAEVVHVSTMHTVDLTDDEELRQATSSIIDAPPDWTVATTGFGMRLWFEAADAWGLGDRLVSALASTRVIARGPKAQSACRQRGLEVQWSAPNESMVEVVAHLASQSGLADHTLAVQLFDPEDHPSTAQLAKLCRSVVEIPVYRWRMPDDRDAVARLVHDLINGRFDAITFTSQPAVRFLFEVAADEGRLDQIVEAFNSRSPLPVCIGPVCAEPLIAAGVETAVWPEPFRLVPMVKLTENILGFSS